MKYKYNEDMDHNRL